MIREPFGNSEHLRRLTILAFALTAVGCQRDHVLVRPGSPVVITEARGSVRISAWSDEANSLLDAGWIDAKSLVGLTATDYDWSK